MQILFRNLALLGSKLTKLLAMSLLVVQLVIPAQGMADSISKQKTLNEPGPTEMVLDGLVVRPVMLGLTVLGTGLFIITSPFSLMGGNFGDAAQELVVKPAKMTFIRCLGCSKPERKFDVVKQEPAN
jgi:hypothetical protein